MDEPEQVPLFSACGRHEGEIEVAPRQKIVPLPQHVEWSRVAIVDWQPQGDNTFRPVARIHERWVRLTKENIRLLGLGLSYQTLHRLIRGGFIRGRQVSPAVWQIDLASFQAHVKAVEDDPEFWENAANARKYKESI